MTNKSYIRYVQRSILTLSDNNSSPNTELYTLSQIKKDCDVS